MRTSDVTDLLAQSARYADDATRNRPAVDIDKLVMGSRGGQFRVTRVALRTAVAAAVMVVAVASIVLLDRSSTAQEPIPDHIVQLVESLYSQHDYVVDEISLFLTGREETDGVSDNDFLDQVWDDVLGESGGESVRSQ